MASARRNRLVRRHQGLTELMEELDREEARAIIDLALKLMIDAAHHDDGYVVQSNRDGIFALLGPPVAHMDHLRRANSGGSFACAR